MTGKSQGRRRIAIAITFFLASAGAAPAQTVPQILGAMENVADWELAHPAGASLPPAPDAMDPLGWSMGTFYTGLTALADRSGHAKYADAIFALGSRQGWKLGPRPFFADDYEVAQNWIWAFDRKRDPKMIAAVRQRFDSIIATNPSGSLLMAPFGSPTNCFQRWCWCDALFMGPPGWAALSRATRDPKYLAYADKEYRATAALLFDKGEALFYRDSSFIGRRGADGEKIFWSRGNGWVYAGLARILSQLPSGSPSRSFYRDLYLKMSRRIVALQKPNGYWASSLLDLRHDTTPETSGTGLFTFGLAWGVKTGLLKDPTYRRAADRGWGALTRAVRKDGKLGWVQQGDVGPNVVRAGDTQPFGAGAFLLAGAAMYDLMRQR
jgi:unsaturated rhamnogalacturonyl hydrolase